MYQNYTFEHILYFYRNLSLRVNCAFNYGKFTAQSVTYPIEWDYHNSNFIVKT